MPEVVELSAADKAEMEIWYVETRDRYWKEEEEEWTAQEYFLACQSAHHSDQMGTSV